MATPEEILAFWFADAATDPALAEARGRFWFGASPETDAACARFASDVERAAAGALEGWEARPASALALLLLLDQLPRNLYRNTPRAFSGDAAALGVAERLLASGADGELALLQRAFVRIPFMHAEDLAAQQRGVALFEALRDEAPGAWRPVCETHLAFAREHRDVIARFGRFPHRNAILGRAPTAAEAAFLDAGGETYGQGGASAAGARGSGG